MRLDVPKLLGLLASFALFAAPPVRSQAPLHEERSASSSVLTLEDAIAAATANNSDVRTRALDSQKAAHVIEEAKTSRYPQLSLYANAGYLLAPLTFTIPKGALGSYTGTGPIPSQDASVTTQQSFTALIYGSASQPLTQLHKVRLAVQDARLGLQLATEVERDQRIHTANEVKAAYFTIVTTQSQIDSAESSLKYLERLTHETEINVAQQTALKADSLAAHAKLVQQRYSLLKLHDSLDTQRESLNRLMGRELSTAFDVEMQSAPEQEELDLSAARRTALQQRPEIRQAALQVKRADLSVRRERANYIPDISLQLNYFSAPNINFLPQNAASAGFLLQWQPFDWGQKHHHIEQLQSTSQQARLGESDAKQQVLIDVGAAVRKLREARALLDAQTAATNAEQEKLRILTNRYEQKAALLSDLLEQESAVAQAHAAKAQAVASFWTSKADFERALGGR